MNVEIKITKKPESSPAARRWTLETTLVGNNYSAMTTTTHHPTRETAIARAAWAMTDQDERVKRAADSFYALKLDVAKEYEAQLHLATQDLEA